MILTRLQDVLVMATGSIRAWCLMSDVARDCRFPRGYVNRLNSFDRRVVLEAEFVAKSDNAFLEGMEAHSAGMPYRGNPYYLDEGLSPSYGLEEYDEWMNSEAGRKQGAQFVKQSDWGAGWKFSRLVKIQAFRRTKTAEIGAAMKRYKSFETKYAGLKSVVDEGVLRQPLKFFSAKSALKNLVNEIRAYSEITFLEDLYFRLRVGIDAKKTAHFIVYDDILSAYGTRSDYCEGPMRDLVGRFGEKHGVQAAWSEYVRADYTKGYDQRSVKHNLETLASYTYWA